MDAKSPPAPALCPTNSSRGPIWIVSRSPKNYVENYG